MIKNKKAAFPFIIVVVSGLIIAQVTMLIFMFKSQKEFNDNGQIGLKQILLFTSYQESEKTLFYVDMAAKWAAEEAFLGTAFRGGFPDEAAECQRYLGFALWDFEDEKCLPDVANEKNNNLALSYQDSMNDVLNRNFKLIPELLIPTDNYDVNIIPILEEPGKSLVTGAAKIPISFDIKKNIVTAGVDYTSYTSFNFPASTGKDVREKLEYVKTNYGQWIAQYSQQYGIPELAPVIAGQIVHESSGRQYAIGYSGEIGISQFIADTAKDYIDIFGQVTPCGCIVKDDGNIDCKKYRTWSPELAAQAGFKCNPENDGRFNPEKNINAQAKYMSTLYKKYRNKEYTDDNAIHLALHGYNRGSSNVDKQTEKAGVFSIVNQPQGWWQVSINGQNRDYAKSIMANTKAYQELLAQGQGD